MNSPIRDIRPAARSQRPVLHDISRVICAAAFAVSLLSGPPARALDSTPSSVSHIEQLLRRAIRVERNINLRGEQMILSFAPQGGTHTTTRHVVWRRDGRSLSTSREPNGKGATVTVDDGKWTSSYSPSSPVVMIAHSPPRAHNDHAAARLARLVLHNYQVVMREPEKLAGRMCDVLELIPRHAASHAVKVWLDARTGVMLSRQENDHRGNTLSLALFKSVQYPRSIADSELRYRPSRKRKSVVMSRSPIFSNVSSLEKRAMFKICQPMCMPCGYAFEACELVDLGGVPVACLRYTDGLANITVYENVARGPRPAGHSPIEWQLLPRGEAMAACSYGPLDIAVMGNVEVKGLLDVARSIDLDDETAALDGLNRRFGVSHARLMAMRDEGIGLDTIAALLFIAAHTRRPLSRLMALYRDGWHWLAIARRLNDNGNQVASGVNLLLKPAKF